MWLHGDMGSIGTICARNSVDLEYLTSNQADGGSNPSGRTMARSTYIYVVMDGANIVSAFTVKHEMITWLGRNPGDYVMFRVSDGGHRPPEDMTAELSK